MNEMTITSAQYVSVGLVENASIRATMDGQELFVPLDPSNRHYAEIMRQVKAGTLTRQDAE